MGHSIEREQGYRMVVVWLCGGVYWGRGGWRSGGWGCPGVRKSHCHWYSHRHSHSCYGIHSHTLKLVPLDSADRRGLNGAKHCHEATDTHQKQLRVRSRYPGATFFRSVDTARHNHSHNCHNTHSHTTILTPFDSPAQRGSNDTSYSHPATATH